MFEEKDTVYWNSKLTSEFYRYGDENNPDYRPWKITKSAFSKKYIVSHYDSVVHGQFDNYEDALNSFSFEV